GKALEDFKYLVENPKVTDREVAHENYYLEGYVALSCTLSQLGRNGEAKGTLQEALNQLKKDPELQGWNRYKRRDVEGLLNRLEKGGAIPIPMMYQALGK
ncbi:MAG: hypothetical protein GWP10_05045, partial [Nitrospiraceae bacterium]|nr:hypothetical protein [Nitrospiraceae bacterium]